MNQNETFPNRWETWGGVKGLKIKLLKQYIDHNCPMTCPAFTLIRGSLSCHECPLLSASYIRGTRCSLNQANDSRTAIAAARDLLDKAIEELMFNDEY